MNTYIAQGSFSGVAVVCATCGALVLDRGVHDQFHAGTPVEVVVEEVTDVAPTDPPIRVGERCHWNQAPVVVTAVSAAGFLRVRMNGGTDMRVHSSELALTP